MNNHLAKAASFAYSLAVQAGESIMRYYEKDNILPEYKQDNSPLTAADKASHAILYKGLAEFSFNHEGQIPILSEEGAPIPFLERQHWQHYWCVDPLDGTKEFIAHLDDFTVNIALVSSHQPIMGVIYIPVKRYGYLAWRGGGAYRCLENGNRERIVTQNPPAMPLRVLVSRHYTHDRIAPWLAHIGQTEVLAQGSALKFCSLACGQADLFLRLSPTAEWDNAAGQCLLEEAGGKVFSLEGNALSYNRSGSLQQAKFIAVGDKLFDWPKLLSL